MHVVCVGDCGVDRYLPLEQDRAGGITLNFAVHARRLFAPEHRVTIVSALGDDTESNVVTAALDELLIEAYLAELPGRTSLQYIDLDPSGEKIFVRYEQGVLGDYRVGSPERAILEDADLLVAPHYEQIAGFFDSVMNTPSRGLRAVDFADIAQHPSTANVRHYSDRFDIAFLGLSRNEGPLIEEVAALASDTDKLIIVTLGADGSLALSRGGRHECSAARVGSVVDTTGAGDTFAAGFLSEYCESRDIAASLEKGAKEAAQTIQQIGAF